MRMMGLDYGDATIGVAVSDLLGITAQGVETIKRKDQDSDFKRLDELIKEKNVTTIVVGFPKNMNNTVGPRGEASIAFCELLKEKFPDCKVALWDERLTTAAARRTLIEGDVRREKRKKSIDMLAAVLILQGYMAVNIK